MVDEDESVDLSFGLEGKVTVVTGGAARERASVVGSPSMGLAG